MQHSLKMFRLITGEEVVALAISHNGIFHRTITIERPLRVVYSDAGDGSRTMFLVPWINQKTTDSNKIEIEQSSVVCTFEASKTLKSYFDHTWKLIDDKMKLEIEMQKLQTPEHPIVSTAVH